MIAILAQTGVVSSNKKILEPGCFKAVCKQSRRGERIWLLHGHARDARSALAQSRHWCGFVEDLQEVLPRKSGGIGELRGRIWLHLSAQLIKQLGDQIVNGHLRFSVAPLVTESWTDRFGIEHCVRVSRMRHVALTPNPAFETGLLSRSA